MRAVSFGRVNIQNHGVPLKFGTSTLNGAIAASDESFVMTSATPFCADMCPFKMDIDPAGTFETVMVKSLNGVTASVQRGIDGTVPAAHASGKSIFAKFQISGWRAQVVSGLTGIMYWGTKNLVVSSGAGVIKQFAPNSAPGIGDDFDFQPPDERGNMFMITDFAMDSAVDGEGLFVTFWER